MIFASLTSQITGWIAGDGVYAVFGLMALDALLPVGSELIMLYAGALGAGAIAGKHATLFGLQLATGSRASSCSSPPERSAISSGRWLDGGSAPVVRSSISIPAGVLGTPLASYAVLTLAGSLIWCLGFAGVGWALGGSWTSFHHSFRYADYAALASCWLDRKRLRSTAGDRGGRLRQTRLRR